MSKNTQEHPDIIAAKKRRERGRLTHMRLDSWGPLNESYHNIECPVVSEVLEIHYDPSQTFAKHVFASVVHTAFWKGVDVFLLSKKVAERVMKGDVNIEDAGINPDMKAHLKQKPWKGFTVIFDKEGGYGRILKSSEKKPPRPGIVQITWQPFLDAIEKQNLRRHSTDYLIEECCIAIGVQREDLNLSGQPLQVNNRDNIDKPDKYNKQITDRI